MPFYHDLVTQKSWQVLQKLRREFDFVLIGGWAVWLYTRGLKSKDIDFIVKLDQLMGLKEKYNLVKNERLRKYEFQEEEISVDVYTAFFSDLGVPVEEAVEKKVTVSGFQVLEKEMLMILKQTAYDGRRLSVKGRKDLLDIFGLAFLPDFDWRRYQELLSEFGLEKLKEQLKEALQKTTEALELGLNRHQFAGIKRSVLARVDKGGS